MFQKNENESSCELLSNLTQECFFRPKMDAIFGIVQGTENISGIKPSKQKARRGEAVRQGVHTHVCEGTGWGTARRALSNADPPLSVLTLWPVIPPRGLYLTAAFPTCVCLPNAFICA